MEWNNDLCDNKRIYTSDGIAAALHEQYDDLLAWSRWARGGIENYTGIWRSPSV
jgi:hypothetical protein